MRRADLRRLTTHRSYPSVSILMPTHRGHPESRKDAIRLKNLLQEARSRLEEEVGKRPSWPMMDRLEELADQINWEESQQGLALFASEEFAAVYRLPFRVEPRVTIDKTFETRDIVYAWHRMPRYRVLAIAEGRTRLFEGTGPSLEEVLERPFPVEYEGEPGAMRGPDGPLLRSKYVREAHQEMFLKQVDDALTEVSRDDPLPLVVLAVTRTLSRFAEVTENADQIALTIEGGYEAAGANEIAEVVWPRFDEWLAEQRRAAVEEANDALGARLLAMGIDDAWKAALAGQGRKLLVEEGYHQPAILHREGLELELLPPGTEEARPEHLDDAVDELIELTLQKGGEVAFVDRDALADKGRVALILRY